MAINADRDPNEYFPQIRLEDDLLFRLKSAVSTEAKMEHLSLGHFDRESTLAHLNAAFEHYAYAIAVERGVHPKDIEKNVAKREYGTVHLESLANALEADVRATRNWIGGLASGVLPKGNIHERKQAALDELKEAMKISKQESSAHEGATQTRK